MPINFLRGANWNNKLIVADEAQNFTFKELTTLITRLGEDSKLIICGDFMQSDINGKTGFNEMFELFCDVFVVVGRFLVKIKRSKLCRKVRETPLYHLRKK